MEFGEPLLRQKARKIKTAEIKTKKFQALIKEMKEFLADKKLGIGLAAPQIGQDASLAIILIQPTKHRSKVKKFELTIINPEIIKTYGRKSQMWEGCISGGSTKAGLFARVPRYKKIELKYQDVRGQSFHKVFEGLPAQVIQHEVDHLSGVLFVDRVKDSKTFVTYRNYLKIIKNSSARTNAKK